MLKSKKNMNSKLFGYSRNIAEDIRRDLTAFSLDMSDHSNITVRGCRKIACYSPVLISLALDNGYINICGKSLLCSLYSGRTVGVCGKIKCVFFSDKMPKER